MSLEQRLAKQKSDERDMELVEAACGGDLARVEELLAAGAGALAMDHRGRSALMWAAGNADLACVELLLPHSDARQHCGTGWTALMHALSAGSADCARAVLPRSDAAAADLSGITPLRVAAQSGSLACVGAVWAELSRTYPEKLAVQARLGLDGALALADPACAVELASLARLDEEGVEGWVAAARSVNSLAAAQALSAYGLMLREREELRGVAAPSRRAGKAPRV